MAETHFDRAAFEARLSTRRLGRPLIAHALLPSTNDAAWEAMAVGGAEGLVVVADAQSSGRGRAGRRWHMAPGRGLALSLLLRPGGVGAPLSVLPLASGLALDLAFERLGVRTALKWPNDLLLNGRKVAGILCESRSAEAGSPGRAVVIGVGVNLSQRRKDFPPELKDATSLALEGCRREREEVAAEFLNALEPLWEELKQRGGAPVIGRWQERASFWGQTVRIHTPAGPVSGVARALDLEGRLVLESQSGELIPILAGDLEVAGAAEP